MKIGTKSVLFGAHCWLIHPWFVAAAWWKLYGFPWDPRLWVAFFVHDLGYWGKPNMDGKEGEDHVWFGAKVMGWLFDPRYPTYTVAERWPGRLCDRLWGYRPENVSWFSFCFRHSRFMCQRYKVPTSRLCVADKLSICLEPWWLYLPRVVLSSEIKEYMAKSQDGKYEYMKVFDKSKRVWFVNMVTYLEAWVQEHKDGKADSWTETKHE